MRIAFMTHQFPGIRMGGLGSYTVAAARALAAAGHDVHIFTFTVPTDVREQFALECGGTTLHEVPDLARRMSTGSASAELASAVQAGGEPVYRLAMGTMLSEAVLAEHARMAFDVVEAPECEGLTVPLMLSLRQERSGGKQPAVVTQIHSGAAISRCGNQQTETALDRGIDALEAAAIVLADGVAAMTQVVVEKTRQALGVEREVTIIPLAVPTEEHYTPPPVHGSVLFVGRLERLKGVDQLIQAAPRFLGACPSARLRFVGPDTPTAPTTGGGEGGGGVNSMRAWMLSQLPEELQSRVEFTGELGPRDVTEQIRGARFLALPSVVENFSLVAAQGLGMGRTCVFRSGIGTAEIYGETGVTFSAGNTNALAESMIALWNDSARLEKLSRGAWERARREFNRDLITRRQIAFYEQAIAATGKRPDLSQMPVRLATSLIEPLIAVMRFACGIREAGQPATPGQRLLAIMQRLAEEERGASVRVLLYGAGRHSTRLLTEQHVWASAGHEVAGFIDDGARWAQGGTHLGLPVVTRRTVLEQLEKKATMPAVVLSTDTFEHQFWEQTRELRERGMRVYRLYGE